MSYRSNQTNEFHIVSFVLNFLHFVIFPRFIFLFPGSTICRRYSRCTPLRIGIKKKDTCTSKQPDCLKVMKIQDSLEMLNTMNHFTGLLCDVFSLI